MKIATAAQMREMDRETTDNYGVPGVVLMENAALRVVEALQARGPDIAKKRVAVVCGKGNNGGDGLAIARHLAIRLGARVTIALAADPDQFTGDAAANYAMASRFKLDIVRIDRDDIGAFSALLRESDIVVDALLGTGIKGAATGIYAAAIDAINASGRYIVSVDIPSGLDSDTGHDDGPTVRAALTVTFALPKFGLLVHPGLGCVGELVVGDIGFPRDLLVSPKLKAAITGSDDIRAWLPPRERSQGANKGTYGHVIVFAGSRGFVGAPVLTAEAAARAGAGLVTLVVPEPLFAPTMSRVSPVVMVRSLPATDSGSFSREAITDALELAKKGSAVAIGPGLGGGDDDETRAFVREFVAQCEKPTVVDADALNILSKEPDWGVTVLRSRLAETVLTPHPGEMGRLLGLKTDEVQQDRRGMAERAARDYDCVALLKGDRTLTASAKGGLWINTSGNPGMGTGGAGDVLTGVIAALIAQGLGALQAAAAGAYIHGVAGDLSAESQGGSTGLIAADLIDRLPAAIAKCHGCDPNKG